MRFILQRRAGDRNLKESGKNYGVRGQRCVYPKSEVFDPFRAETIVSQKSLATSNQKRAFGKVFKPRFYPNGLCYSVCNYSLDRIHAVREDINSNDAPLLDRNTHYLHVFVYFGNLLPKWQDKPSNNCKKSISRFENILSGTSNFPVSNLFCA
jgi:hypothetical protein